MRAASGAMLEGAEGGEGNLEKKLQTELLRSTDKNLIYETSPTRKCDEPGLLLSSPFLLFHFHSLLSPLLRSFSLETTHQLLHPLIVRHVLRFLPLLHHRCKEAIVFTQLPHRSLLLSPILCTQLLSSSPFRVWVLRAKVRGRP